MSLPGSTSGADDDRLARVALSVVGEPGDPLLLGFVADHGAEAVLERLRGEESAEPRLRGLDPERVLTQAHRRGLRFVTPSDDEWPGQLDDLATTPPLQDLGGMPVGLWVRGPMRLDRLARSVAIVGSRSATTYGADVAAGLAADAVRAGRPVVSGGAFGIDQAAHRGALVGGGPTVVVLACGADRIYPAAHRQLIEHVAETGAVLAEAPPGGNPMKHRFLSRNRLIAAITTGTVVVEAAARSGALNTANWATRLNRPLMAVPGPVTSAASEGVHQQIRSGAASLVTNGAELLEEVGAVGADLAPEPRGPERRRDRLTRQQARVLEAVPVMTGAGEQSVARTAGLSVGVVRDALAELTALGMVRRDDTGWRLAAPAHGGAG